MKRFLLLFIFLIATSIFSEEKLILSIADIEELALKNHVAIILQKTDQEISVYQKEIAEANNLPEIGATAGYTYIDPAMKGKISIIPGTELRPRFGYHDNYSVALQMRYLLFGGGKVQDSIEASKLGEEASKFLLKDAIHTARLEARKAYFNTLYVQELTKLVKDSEKRAKGRLQDAENKFKAGTITKLELLRIRTEAADAETLSSETADNLRNSLDQLKLILNISTEVEIGFKDNLKNYEKNLSYLDTASFHQNSPLFPKAEAANLNVKRAQKKADIEKADFYPTVSTAVKMDHANPYQMDQKFGNILSANISASLPILDWGKNKNEYNIALAEVKKAQTVATNTRRQLENYYKSLIYRIESLKKGMVARKLNLEKAIASRDAAEVARSNGAATYNDLADTELLKFRIELDYVRNISELLIVISDWERFSEEPSGIFGKNKISRIEESYIEK